MARTKENKPGHAGRARRLRQQQQQQQQQQQEEELGEDRTSAPVMMLGGTAPGINAEEESDDESMDLDESDRFSIDLNYPAPISPGPDVDGAKETSELEQRYLQKPIETLNQTGSLWQQPPPNDLGRRSRKGKHAALAISLHFNQSCRLFEHWQLDFDRCIPEELRKRTPYSLALLTELRKLASHTKDKSAAAHDMLLRIARERIGELEMWKADPDRPYFVETKSQIAQQCVESMIQENVFGLMIEDVQNALREINNEPNPDRPPRMNGLGGLRRSREGELGALVTRKGVKKSRIEKREAKAANKAARQKSRRERKEERQQRQRDGKRERDQFAHYQPPAIRDQGLNIAPPNSPALQSSNKFSALSEQFTISTNSRSQHTVPLELPHAEATEQLSRHDKENYEGMARMMVKMGVKHSKPSVGKKRLNRLTAGGLSRRGGGGSLPSERMDLANVSALPAPAAPTSALSPEEIAQMDRLALDDLPD